MRKFDNINVIPFIDILLVLLAIVLTTATFVSSGQLDINLPAAGSGSEPTDISKIEIALDSNNLLYFDGMQIERSQLRAALINQPEDIHILLLIDENVVFKGFVDLIDLFKSLSLQNVSIATRKAS